MQWKVEPDVDLKVLLWGAVGLFDDPFQPPIFDITKFVRGQGVTITRGRSDEFQGFQAGSCSFTLKNDNREFDPSLSKQLLVDGGASGEAPEDIFDGGASTPPASILDANAESNASMFAFALQPMRRLQVLATYQGVQHVLFTGYVDGWPRGWASKTTGDVKITARDALAAMARAVIAPSHGVLTLDDPIHGRLDTGRLAGDLPEQFTGERVTTLLQLAGFTAGASLVADTGLTRVIGVAPTGNIRQLIQQAELAEAGFFFVDKDGVIRFYDRHSRFRKTRTANVQAVFTDSQYSGLEVERNLNQVWNDVMFSRPTAGEHDEANDQHFTDSHSLHEFGILSYHQEIPVISDGETLGRAEFWVNRYGEPKDRPTPIVIRPRRNMPQLFAACAGRELLDRIQIQRTPLGVGPTTTFTGLVEQVEHRITNESWETTLAISPIDVDEGQAFLVLDDATFGKLDQGTIAY